MACLRPLSRLRLSLVLLLSALLLSACSLLDFAYHQLDWLMLRKVESVVDLNGEQRARLRQDIDALLKWHCETQVPRYAGFLTTLERDFRTREMTAARWPSMGTPWSVFGIGCWARALLVWGDYSLPSSPTGWSSWSWPCACETTRPPAPSAPPRARI